MGREDLLMLQLFGGGAGWLQSGGWLQVLYLGLLFAVPVLRPERIRVAASYRAAWFCFALSIIIPSAGSVVLMYLVSPDGTPRGFSGGFAGMQSLQLCSAAGPVLFGISLILAMKAVVPGFIPPTSSYPTSARDPLAPSGGHGQQDGHASESQT